MSITRISGLLRVPQSSDALAPNPTARSLEARLTENNYGTPVCIAGTAAELLDYAGSNTVRYMAVERSDGTEQLRLTEKGTGNRASHKKLVLLGEGDRIIGAGTLMFADENSAIDLGISNGFLTDETGVTIHENLQGQGFVLADDCGLPRVERMIRGLFAVTA